MASDYAAIRADNERGYGTYIGRTGPMLLANRYADRTHFIFELLQNAEDALARRRDWQGLRSVSFQLKEDALRVSHAGEPFDDDDVRGICGIGESKKDLTAIGRFGIGFKSVYAFTDRPEIHSGDEDFAIESFVWPVAVPAIARAATETVILVPLRASDGEDQKEIAAGLKRLGPAALLFLRHIEEIDWSVPGGNSGVYLRESREVDELVRRITVIGQEAGRPDIEETWLVFSRPVADTDGLAVGYVEIAFLIAKHNNSEFETVQQVDRSPLVVFFPTVLETYLGFLVQGPYRTTPSRDNVPLRDPWNQYCVKETARVLVDALRWLRDHDQLNVDTLRRLPLDPDKFGDGVMFAPLFETAKRALTSERLLPRYGGGYVAAANAKLARTQELRELFDATQLTALFGGDSEVAWISGDISQDRTPELRQYLMNELDIAEVTPDATLWKLNASFLELQPDEWMLRLYEFLNDQPALRWRAAQLPLIRLADGSQVQACENGQPQAFLPGAVETDFPTVRAAVCRSEAARAFLRALDLTEPDPVDDVIRNVLPKYLEDQVDIADDAYEDDIRRIVAAFATDSKGQREKLLTALSETPFVMAVDTGDGGKVVEKPGQIYLATDRLKELFAGVSGVLRVDDRYPCLRGEEVRELLEPAGATRYLQPIPAERVFTWEHKREIRRRAGLERAKWERPPSDVTLRGLDALLALIPKLTPRERRQRTSLLWQALGDVEDRRGARAFLGEYTWGYSHETKTATFDAAFVQVLNEKEWVPGAEGNLERPEFVLFDSLGWKANPFLQSKIRFKAPIIDQLAKEAGIEPGVLDLLKKHGVTSVAELTARLRLEEDTRPEGEAVGPSTVGEALDVLLGPAHEPGPPVPDPAGADPVPSGSRDGGSSGGGGTQSSDGGSRGAGASGGREDEGKSTGSERGGGKLAPGSAGARSFISYVATYPEEEELDPDGVELPARMALEARAIDCILEQEPNWQRTPALNPGFDLFQVGSDGRPSRWCEVKAMTGGLDDRPVGVSRAQFECAAEHGKDYWLYVVEHACDENARVVRIQDPAGNARTFTFDRGWLGIAHVDAGQEDQED
jgi:hypothetical protein